MTTVFFLGRSLEGILADAMSAFGEDLGQVVVVQRDNDNLPAPDGLRTVGVTQFVRSACAAHELLRDPGSSKAAATLPEVRPICDEAYRLVANGGTTAQLVKVLLHLVQMKVKLEVFDLQREGPVLLHKQ